MKDEIVLEQLKQQLEHHSEKDHQKAIQKFFKEAIVVYGVRVGTVRKIGNQFFKKIESPDKQKVFTLCEKLLKTDFQEDSIIAFQWASKYEKDFTPDDFKVFERWVKKYINNWAKCDDFCTGALGKIFKKYPELIKQTYPWRSFPNRWVRRAAAVSLIVSIKNKQHLAEVLAIADVLLQDPDDLVQKGYGWLLKVTSMVFPYEVFEFVMQHKKNMPRTALRYAIEKLSKEQKQQAMQQ